MLPPGKNRDISAGSERTLTSKAKRLNDDLCLCRFFKRCLNETGAVFRQPAAGFITFHRAHGQKQSVGL
jgi:hypothetical protein